MSHKALVAVLAYLVCFVASGQEAAQLPSFEVASVKPGGGAWSLKPDRWPGRIRWTTPLAFLVGYAYDVDITRLEGKGLGPIYSIEATFDPAATDAQVRLMAQSLLAERFHMKCHRVTAETEGYALLVGTRGLKMKESKAELDPSRVLAGTLNQRGVVEVAGPPSTMPQLAAFLERAIKKPVWDKTGLKGLYDIAFRFADTVEVSPEADAPFIEKALEESLGLRLEKVTGPVERVIVDSIEKPTEN